MELQQAASIVMQVAMGLGLAACAGLRAFLPLFAVGVAGRLDLLPLSSSFAWLESWPALTVFGVAVVVELLADKFPVIDNFLDAVQVLTKPVAGMAVAASVLTELTPLQAAVFAIILGGGTAGTVHVLKAKTRLVSSAVTAGLGNPLLSLLEDVVAVAGSIVSMLLPLLALVVLLLAVVLLWLGLRHRRASSVPAAVG